MRYLFMLTALLLSIFVGAQTNIDESNNKKAFYILFGEGFNNDTISLKVNGVDILNNAIFKSDTVSGYVSSASIHYDGKLLKVLNNRLDTNTTKTFNYSDRLRIELEINQMPYDLLALLKKGRYILISKHTYYYNVYINQYKKPIKFE